MKPLRNAIAFVIYNEDRSKILEILRPMDDEDLPNVWGLPAGTIKNGETFEECIHRSLKEKLGIEGDIVKFIGEGSTNRKDYDLFMKLYEVKITKGTPKAPQKVLGVTQYQRCEWRNADDLRKAASMGSLCCTLYLQSIGKW